MKYKTKNPYEQKKLEAARKIKMKRIYIIGSAIAAAIIILAAVLIIPAIINKDSSGVDGNTPDVGANPDVTDTGSTGTPTAPVETDSSKPHVLITMENGGEILLELEPDVAPITVANFLKLVNEGFYEGLNFHRISPTFMIQGGNGYSLGRDADSIKGEFSENGVPNDISHVRGVISMARTDDMDSASSQFFIMTADSTFLNGKYAAFGRVISGMDIVDRIANADATPLGDNTGSPINPEIIKSIIEV